MRDEDKAVKVIIMEALDEAVTIFQKYFSDRGFDPSYFQLEVKVDHIYEFDNSVPRQTITWKGYG